MSFSEARVSLQLATEERAGARLRDMQRRVLAQQDAGLAALRGVVDEPR